MRFSEKLKQAMQQLDINQVQVVGLTGKSKGSVSQYLQVNRYRQNRFKVILQ